MEILPVTELGEALHAFVNKDDKQAFHLCVQHNLDETRVRIEICSLVTNELEDEVLQSFWNCCV